MLKERLPQIDTQDLDPQRQYMQEINAIRLLKPDEEVGLAMALERGKRAILKLSCPNLDEKQREEFLNESSQGRKAFRELMRHNQRLVVSIASRYTARGLPLLDLIQEGNIGLARAVEKFEYRLDNKLSTYATWWIRQAITRAIANQGRTVRLSVQMIERISLILRIERALTQEFQREPTSQEIAQESESLTAEEVGYALSVAPKVTSLDQQVNGDSEKTIADITGDPNNPDPAEVSEKSFLKEDLERALAELSTRESKVIRLRFGLEDDIPKTLREIGAELKVSAEMVRKVEDRALEKLRHPGTKKYLSGYLS